MNRINILVLIVLLTASTQVLARIIYVKAGSTNPVAPYLTRETAADSIKKATRISLPGDTIYVLNGTYKEQVILKESQSIIGQSIDSTIIYIDFNFTARPYYIINVWHNCLVKNLNIKATRDLTFSDGAIGGYDSALTDAAKNIIIESVKIKLLGQSAIRIKSGKVINCQFFNIYSIIAPFRGIGVFQDSCYIDCVNLQAFDCEQMVEFLYSTHTFVSFKNSFFNSQRVLVVGSATSSADVGATFTNCLFLWGAENVINNSVYNNTIVEFNLNLENCTFSGRTGVFLDYRYGKLSVRNCLFAGTGTVLKMTNQGTVDFKYNFFSRYKIPSFLDTTNINGENTPPTYEWRYYNYSIKPERRLDRYSEAIDKGDPLLKDEDGSRSDIGCAGGPGGFSYPYPDLAPSIPDTVWVIKNNEESKYQYYWRQNPEPDFSHYEVFGNAIGYLSCFPEEYLGTVNTNSYEVGFQRFPAGPGPIGFISYDTAGNASACLMYREAPRLVMDVEKDISTVLQTGIASVYPNPSTGSIKVKFNLGKYSKISLSVYTLNGEEISAVLCNEERFAGTYTQEVHLKGASGIYLVRLTVVNDKGEKKEFTQKVSLVK